MAQSNGRPIYEQVLEHARREIDEATSEIEELSRSLHLLETRVEAAKAVYGSVAARLNLEDELVDRTELNKASYPDEPLPLQAPEPPEDEEVGSKEAGNGIPGAFSVDLIPSYLEQKVGNLQEEDRLEKASETQELNSSEGYTGFGLSDADRQLISEYLRSKRDK